MNPITLPGPFLGIFGIDDAIVFIILLAIIAAALISIALDLNKIRKDNKAAEAARAQQKALTDLKAYVSTVQGGGSADSTQCAEMRRLYEVAVSAGVNQLVLASIKTQIDSLCPD